MRKFIAALALLGAGMCLNEYIKNVHASRNSAGTYTLPAGNPVVAGTTIATSWANGTMPDIGTELTNSLDRNGRGGMLAPLRGVDGTVAAPAFSYTSETGSGEYRIGAGDLGWAISGAKKLELTSALFTITPSVSLGGAALSAPSTPYLSLMGGAAQFNLYMQDTRGATGNKVGRLVYDGSSLAGGTGNLAKPGWQFQNVDDTGAFVSGGLLIYRDGTFGPITIGASGTAISASYGGTYNINIGLIATAACGTSNQTLTGAPATGICTVSADGNSATNAVWYDCRVASLNNITIRACNATGGNFTFGAQNYIVRVFAP